MKQIMQWEYDLAKAIDPYRRGRIAHAEVVDEGKPTGSGVEELKLVLAHYMTKEVNNV